MTTIGQKLQAEREERGWSVEFVSFRSRIQANIIEHLEADDYAIFSSSAYVRSFLRKYCELLELDLEREISLIRDPEQTLLDHPTARESVKENLESAEFAPQSPRFRRASAGKGSPVFLFGSVFILLFGLGTFYYLGSRASNPDAGTFGLFEDFESKFSFFTRERASREPHSGEQEPVTHIATGGALTKRMGTTAENSLIKPVAAPSGTGELKIRKPDLRSFSPLPEIETSSFPDLQKKEPLVRARARGGFPLGIE